MLRARAPMLVHSREPRRQCVTNGQVGAGQDDLSLLQSDGAAPSLGSATRHLGPPRWWHCSANHMPKRRPGSGASHIELIPAHVACCVAWWSGDTSCKKMAWARGAISRAYWMRIEPMFQAMMCKMSSPTVLGDAVPDPLLGPLEAAVHLSMFAPVVTGGGGALLVGLLVGLLPIVALLLGVVADHGPHTVLID